MPTHRLIDLRDALFFDNVTGRTRCPHIDASDRQKDFPASGLVPGIETMVDLALETLFLVSM